jgi:hypothetical protein
MVEGLADLCAVMQRYAFGFDHPGRPQPGSRWRWALPQLVKDPAASCIEYADGTKATLLMLDGAIGDFNIAVRLAGQDLVSTQFFMPPAPNETYSACLAAKIDQMYQTRATPYPIQRTLLTTGVLEACLNSRHRPNERLETPHLVASYQPPGESQYVRT